MDVQSLLPVVQISLLLIVASFGLRARWHDLFAALSRPMTVLRGLVAVNLIVPAVAVAVALILPIAPIVRIGIVAMAIAPIAPLVPGRMLKTGADQSVAIGLYAALLLLSLAIVPASLGLVGLLGDGDAVVPVRAIVRLMLLSGLLPLLAGLAVGSLLPAYSQRLAAAANIAGSLIVLAFILFLVIRFHGAMLSLLGDGTLAAILVTIAAGLAAGHWLGGPTDTGRRALALAAATRHPGVAALVLHANLDDRRAMLSVVLFLLTSLVATTLYERWAKARAASAPAVPAPAE